MKKINILLVVVLISAFVFVAGCDTNNVESKTTDQVDSQSSQYQVAQPIHEYDWSSERAALIQIYDARVKTAATYSVWRSYTGLIEGDCPSIGYPIPYGTEITNPQRQIPNGYHDSPVIGQPEPNGLFPSTASQATWVLCSKKVNGRVVVSPVYVEDQVTSYPYPVLVNYTSNRVEPVENVMPSVVLDLTNRNSSK